MRWVGMPLVRVQQPPMAETGLSGLLRTRKVPNASPASTADGL